MNMVMLVGQCTRPKDFSLVCNNLLPVTTGYLFLSIAAYLSMYRHFKVSLQLKEFFIEKRLRFVGFFVFSFYAIVCGPVYSVHCNFRA
jgi:hypothetical protein